MDLRVRRAALASSSPSLMRLDIKLGPKLRQQIIICMVATRIVQGPHEARGPAKNLRRGI